jgi:hypothetical protein
MPLRYLYAIIAALGLAVIGLGTALGVVLTGDDDDHRDNGPNVERIIQGLRGGQFLGPGGGQQGDGSAQMLQQILQMLQELRQRQGVGPGQPNPQPQPVQPGPSPVQPTPQR